MKKDLVKSLQQDLDSLGKEQQGSDSKLKLLNFLNFLIQLSNCSTRVGY